MTPNTAYKEIFSMAASNGSPTEVKGPTRETTVATTAAAPSRPFPILKVVLFVAIAYLVYRYFSKE